MELTTTFNIGDIVWFGHTDNRGNPKAEGPLTIGQVGATLTDSPGIGDTIFDNYSAQKKYEERYMCIETGIGSGSVYNEKNLFKNATQAEEYAWLNR